MVMVASLLLSLDPPSWPSLPGPIEAVLQFVWSFPERFGWYVVIGLILYFLLKPYYLQWQKSRQRTIVDPVHVEEVTTKVRQIRLEQQVKYAASIPPHKKDSTQHDEEERKVQRKYADPNNAPRKPGEPEERLTFDEVFGNLDEGFYKGRKNKKYGGNDSSSSSSTSSSRPTTSGFKPYTKPPPSGGGRRFGGGGGGKKG